MPNALEEVRHLVTAFIDSLYASSTIRYACNHSQMEAWVAVEGLEFFAARGWNCWETLGFITRRPGTNGATNKELRLKFPDLVCVKGDLSLWWEFKSISPLVLHPRTAGGTFLEDVRALAGFHQEKTRAYLEKGTLRGVRKRNDSINIVASGLRDQLGKSRNVGVAMIFRPGDAEIKSPNGAETWLPDAVVRNYMDKLEKAEPAGTIQDISSAIADTIGRRHGSAAVSAAAEGRGRPACAALPGCHAWLVPMESTP